MCHEDKRQAKFDAIFFKVAALIQPIAWPSLSSTNLCSAKTISAHTGR
jgi:hypothetical protein